MRLPIPLRTFLRSNPAPIVSSKKRKVSLAPQKNATVLPYQLLIERMPFGVLITRNERVQSINYALRVFLNNTPTNNQKMENIFPVSAEIQVLTNAAQKAIQQKIPHWQTEVKLTDTTGNQKSFHIWVILLSHTKNPLVGWIFWDITTSVEKEKRLQKVTKERDKAIAANVAKTAFLANISHELRTPLNAILGFSQAIANETFGPLQNPQYRTYLNYIIASGQHLLSLINDILDLSGLEVGKHKIHEQPIQLYPLLQDILVLISHYPEAQNRQISLKMTDKDILLKADERAIKQILLNLLSNAIKFTKDQGRVQITVTRLKSGGIKIAVKDNGIGIAQDKIKQLFHPFAQIENTLNHSKEGTGLGLVLVQKLTEAHQGTVRLTSKSGVGTNILVEFPAERVIK